MNKLLTRQIKKYLSDDDLKSAEVQNFINAIDRSYINYENQFKMSQRATKISSDELYDANVKLRKDAENQKKIINSLKYVVKVLKLESADNLNDVEESVDLVKFIEKQSNEILAANKIRENLLSNLELKNEELNNYAHIVSHDLKTPLRSIDTLLNWVIEDEDNDLTDDSTEHFSLILKNLEKMDALINGILNYSTIENSELFRDEIKTLDLIKEIKQTLLFPENIELIIDQKLPIVKGDKFRLHQVFQNLIQNAMGSFEGKAGKVEVGVECKGKEWEFYVSDTGKGIDEIYHERIFRIFESLENNINNSGIGLSIVKKIVNFYGGKIWLDSEVSKGTTFYFTIPKTE
ncbi:His Kinase A (phospho-acceptor) domain-containing protein [Lutibacter oricola]|uniref:histidine kinase n=1 Tax=Lutibacter oricola TaxID=762486 RepID=A0A1H3AFX3_9FLAO|nr:HAMP domain-containing sensor histidine kinase [Lutibacter oricola]SDX28602.1 His Kinase A (phospho-acceptor) domain-containing protein [Lutibacter oricola]